MQKTFRENLRLKNRTNDYREDSRECMRRNEAAINFRLIFNSLNHISLKNHQSFSLLSAIYLTFFAQ